MARKTYIISITFVLVSCGLLSPKTIVVKKDEHIDAQTKSCLWFAHKCLDLEYAIEDMELSQADLGLMIENDLACWEEWQNSGCAVLLEELPTKTKIEIPKEQVRKIEIPQTLTPIKLPKNPYGKEKKK